MMQGRFRKRPVSIDAWRNVAGNPIPSWLARAGVRPGETFEILTLEGAMHTRPGDWIIRGIAGELYPCRHEIFFATYEPVEASA